MWGNPNWNLVLSPSEGCFLESNTKFAMNPRKMLFSVKSFVRSSARFTFIQVKRVNESFIRVHVKMPCAVSFKCEPTLITEDNERAFVWKGMRHFFILFPWHLIMIQCRGHVWKEDWPAQIWLTLAISCHSFLNSQKPLRRRSIVQRRVQKS